MLSFKISASNSLDSKCTELAKIVFKGRKGNRRNVGSELESLENRAREKVI